MPKVAKTIMDPAERAALDLGLADLALLMPHQADPELNSRLQAMARHSCTQVINQARHRDPLALDSLLQARESLRLQTERDRALAELTEAAGQTVGSALLPLQYPYIIELLKQMAASRARAETIQGRRVSNYRSQLHHQLPALAVQLGAAAQDYQEAEKRMKDFFGSSKGLWDLDAGTWRSIDWKQLEEAAAFAKDWPEVRELARRLGRKWSSSALETSETDNSAVPITEWDHHDEHLVEDLGRSEITGLTQGRDLSILPVSEMALLFDPDCEPLFYKRHAEGSLLNLDYITQADRLLRHDTRRTVAPPPLPREQGPVIICTDSSGSMSGLPERVAKALTLAIARICLENERGCYLIAFSTGIQCLDLSDPVRVLPEFIAFMAHSFHGGTDLRPALYRSLELLDNPQWVNADLLIISDFRVPKLMIKKSGLIEPIRHRHEARLHALSISPSLPIDDLHIFDSHWHFRTGLKGEAQGISPGQFKEI